MGQEYNLDPTMDHSDNTTKEYMDYLEDVGEKLLNKAVLRVNVNTFEPDETGQGTNAEALDRCVAYTSRFYSGIS